MEGEYLGDHPWHQEVDTQELVPDKDLSYKIPSEDWKPKQSQGPFIVQDN